MKRSHIETAPARHRVLRKRKWVDFMTPGSHEETPESTFYVARLCPRHEQAVAAEQARAAAQAAVPADVPVTCESTYGGDCLALRYRDRAHVWAVLTAALRAGMPLQTQAMRMPVYLQPADAPADPVAVLTPDDVERAHVRHIRAELDRQERFYREHWSLPHWTTPRERAVASVLDCNLVVYRHAAAWRTDEGRALVAQLRTEGPAYLAREPTSSDEEVWTDVDEPVPAPASTPAALLPERMPVASVAPVAPLTIELAEDDDDDPGSVQRCVVCLDARAATLVLPCMHQVVCRACSARLRDTPQARQCVLCRGAIDAILADEVPRAAAPPVIVLDDASD